MVYNALSIVGVLQVSLLTLIWLTPTTIGEEVHNHTSEKSSPNMEPGDHTALNKFIEDVLKAQDELADIRTLDASGLHKPEKVEYPNSVSTDDHAQQKGTETGGANVHNDLNIASPHGKETPSFGLLKTNDIKIEQPLPVELLPKNDKNENLFQNKNENLFQNKNENLFQNKNENLFQNKNENLFQSKNENLFQNKNDSPLIKTTGGGKMSRNIAGNYRKQSYQPNLDSNQDDSEMLKYLTSSFPKENHLLQQGQMQEKPTLDTDRISQMFSAMKKNYFPAVKPENAGENSGESKFDQSNEEGNDNAMIYEDLLQLKDKQMDAGHEPMQTSSLEYKQVDDKDDNMRNEGRYESHMEAKSLDDQDTVGKELKFLNHLEGDSVDWKDTSKNEPSYAGRLENKALDEKYGVRNQRMYAHDLQDKALDEKYGVRNQRMYAHDLQDKALGEKYDVRNEHMYAHDLQDKALDEKYGARNQRMYAHDLQDKALDEKYGVENEPRYERYSKNKPLNKNFNVRNEPRYASNFNDAHVRDKVALENELGYSRNLEDRLDNAKQRFHGRPRTRSEDQQRAEVYPDARSSSDQAHEDPAVVKYFQTHGRRHNRNARLGLANYANSEENPELPDDNTKLRQAHERLQLEDADGLLVGMRARIGTTDNQMELENVNQDKVTPRHDEEEDIQQQLEEEKLIFYPYVPGQTPAVSGLRIGEYNPFTNERGQKISFSPDPSNALPRGFRLDKQPDVKVFSDENEQNSPENDMTVAENAQKNDIRNENTQEQEITNEENAQENDITNEKNSQENDVGELGDGNGQSKEDENLSEDYNFEPILNQPSDVDKNSGYYKEHSPVLHEIIERSIEGDPQSVQNLIMDDSSQDIFPSYNVRHLLDFEEDADQQTNVEQQQVHHTERRSVSNARTHGGDREKRKRNTIGHGNEDASRFGPDTSVRNTRAVVKRPGAIWQDEESNVENEEWEGEANQVDTELGSNALEGNAAKHVPAQSPAQSPDQYQTHVLDPNLEFWRTEEDNIPAKRQAENAKENKNVNLKGETKRKRRSRNNPDNEVNESQSVDNADSDGEVETSEGNEETHTKQAKREEDWHKKLKGLENKYKNFRDKSKQARISDKVHHNHNDRNNVAEAKHKVRVSQEKETSQVDHLFDPSLRSDAQRLQPNTEDAELEEYKSAEQDSYKDRKSKLRGTNVRSLLEKTSKDYEDVSKELKQVMKSLVTQGKSTKGSDYERPGDSLYNEFEAHNSGVVKLGRPTLKEEYQSQPLAENNEENDHVSVGYPSQSSKVNLADRVEIEQKENNLNMEYESLQRKKKEVLDLDAADLDQVVGTQSTEEGLNKKMDSFEKDDSKFGPNRKRDLSVQIRDVEQPVSKIQNHKFRRGSSAFKSSVADSPESQIKWRMQPMKMYAYSLNSNPAEVSDRLETNAELVYTEPSSDIQSAMNKETGNEDNVSAGIFNGDTNEDSNDALNENRLNDRDSLDSLQSHNHYFNSDVKKRNTHVRHSRNIPQELLNDISVSTRELDRLISEGNLPVLKRVKRSHNDSVLLDGVVSKNGAEQNGNYESEVDNGENVALNEQEESMLSIPYDSEFQKERFKKSLDVKDKEVNQNKEETGNSGNADDYEKAKRETEEEYNFLVIRDILNKGKNKAKSANLANDHTQESSKLDEDAEVIQKTSSSEQDSIKSVDGIDNHSLNKRETLHNRNPNVHNANAIHFSNKRNNVNTLGNGFTRNVNQNMYHNNVEEKRMAYGEKRRSSVSDVDGHSSVHHEKYRVNARRQDRSGSQGRKNDNLKEELDPHGISKLSRQTRNKMDVDYKTKHRKAKAVHEMKPTRRVSSRADSDGMHLLSDQQSDSGMLYDDSRSLLSNQGYSKLRSTKPASSFQDNSLVDNELFGNDLPDYATDDKSSTLHGAELNKKNTRFVNTLAHAAPDESQKRRSSTSSSSDYAWNAQPDELEMDDTSSFEDASPRNAWSKYGNSRKSRKQQAEDARPKHSLSDDLSYPLDNDKESPSTQYHSKLSKGDEHYVDIDKLLQERFPDPIASDKEDDTSYRFQNNYNLGHSTENTGNSISVLENNEHADSNYKFFKPYEVPNYPHSETNNLHYQDMHSSQTNYLRPGEYDIFPTVSLRSKQPTRCISSSQPDDSIPLFPVDQKHSKAYNGELDDGMLGMNIVDTILNQVYGSKNLQLHIGPGLHRNYTPTKIEQINTQSRARQKMISQISTIIDKGLEEERKQKACVQLPSNLQKFLDWLVKDDKCPPANHHSHSQPNAHPFYTCDQQNADQQNTDQQNTSPPEEPSDLQKKSKLLKKLTEEYDKLSECEKSQVQNVHDVLSMETNIVSKLLEDEELSKKNQASDATSSSGGNSGTSSENGYNLPVLNFEDSMSAVPGTNGNESQFDMPGTFVMPIMPDGLGNDSKLGQQTGTGDEDDAALITQDLEGLGLPQHGGEGGDGGGDGGGGGGDGDGSCGNNYASGGGGGGSCSDNGGGGGGDGGGGGGSCGNNDGDHHLVKMNYDSHTGKDNMFSPNNYNSHEGLTKEQWMNDFERTKMGEDTNLRRRSYAETSPRMNGKRSQGQTTSNGRWSPEYRYNNNYVEARSAKGARQQRQFAKDVDRAYGRRAEYYRNSPVRGSNNNKRSRYSGNDQGRYYNGEYQQQARGRPARSNGGPAHVSNEYRRLLARADQIRRKRSRGEANRESSWGQ